MKGKRILSILLLIAIMITSLPVGIFANGNNASLPSNPKTGSGQDAWKYWTGNNEAIRYTILWAPTEQDYVEGSDRVVPIGEVTDISRTGLQYKVERYTINSVFDYMNPGRNIENQLKYTPRYDEDQPYDWVGPTQSNLIKNMPKVFRSTPKQAIEGQQEWREFFHGPYVNGEPTYENVEELARLAGATLSKEDYIKGDLVVDGFTVKSEGTYKIYVEPLINMIADNYGTVSTFRDLIRQNADLPSFDGKTILGWLAPTFVHTANSMVLINPEASLGMITNNGKALTYNNNTGQKDRAEIAKQIAPTGHAYKSMGVGVFTSPNVVPSGETNLVITYVKIIGVNPDGTIKYEQIKDTEVIPAELDNEGRVLNIQEVIEIDEGTAYLNDIIVSPKDLTEGNIKWDKTLPESTTGSISANSTDIWRYNFGRLTDIYISIKNDITSNVYEGNKDKVEKIENIIRKGVQASKLDILKMSSLMVELSKEIGGDILTQTKIIQKAIEIETLEDVILDTTAPIEEQVDIEIILGNHNSSKKSTDYIEEENHKSTTIEVKRSTGYLRYIVYPTRKEVIFEEIYKDGVLIDTTIKEKDLPYEAGVIDDAVVMTDKTGEGFTFVEYKTSKELLNTMPTNPLKEGSTYETITGVDYDENVYVRWKKEIVTTSLTGDVVEEWRLSKLKDSLEYKNQAYMGLQLFRSRGHAGQWLTPSGAYSYSTINPNGQITVNNTPGNMKYLDWIHSKALTQGNYSVTLGKPNVFVDITGNANYIKSSALSGYKAATWTNSSNDRVGLEQYDILAGDKGTEYMGNPFINKQETLKFGILNNSTYIHTYSVHHHVSTLFGSYCYCYNQSGVARPTYETADYNVNVVFDRHSTVNTDSRLFKLGNPIEKVENGKTTLSKQETAVLNVYPEIPMLFENNEGTESIKFVAGEQARKVQPVSFHRMEYIADVKLTAIGMSVATSSQARQTANLVEIGNKPVIHKGSGLTITSEVKKDSTSNERGQLVVKTYSLDVADSVKNTWGNGSYNTNTINNNFLSLFGKVEAGKWIFPAKATEKLEIGNTYSGPTVENNIKYTEKSKDVKTHTLTVRGGVLTHVNGTPILTIKTNNPELYESLEGMKLVGSNKDSTVLSTFEHQTGKALTENSFKDLSKTARNGIDNLEIGKGWYSEDSTVLVIKEYTTILEIPTTGFTDKISMTVKGLETPVNKMQFYTKIEKGHSIVRYSVKGSSLISESYFEYNSKIGNKFGKQEVNYGVPNVSISDTTGLF